MMSHDERCECFFTRDGHIAILCDACEEKQAKHTLKRLRKQMKSISERLGKRKKELV